MKLAVYNCTKCEKENEVIFNDSEEQPDILKDFCEFCGGDLERGLNVKNNCQVWGELGSGGHQ